MSVVEYKGFQGSIEWEDGALAIQVLHIEDLLVTYCSNAEEVQAVFEELVDGYLEACAQVGKEPNKPFKGTFNVRVEPSTHRQAALAATASAQTLNAWVADAIREKLDRSGRADPRIRLSVGWSERVQRLIAAMDSEAHTYLLHQSPSQMMDLISEPARPMTGRFSLADKALDKAWH